MQFQKRKSDLALFKERAEALQKAVHILDEGIASSRSQVSLCFAMHRFLEMEMKVSQCMNTDVHSYGALRTSLGAQDHFSGLKGCCSAALYLNACNTSWNK